MLRYFFVLIGIIFLGANCLLQKRIKSALLYPLATLCGFTLWVYWRGFSSVEGIYIFLGGLLFFYLIYWFDLILTKKHVVITLKRSITFGTFILVNLAILIFLFAQAKPLTGYQVYHIPSESMVPTLQPNDFVLVDTHWYSQNTIARNDVLIFNRPQKDLVYIKRVVYLEGDDFLGKTLPKNHYAVLGDNKKHSKDSRHFGLIAKKEIIGKAICVILSIEPKNYLRKNRVLITIK